MTTEYQPHRNGTGYCAALWCDSSKSRHPHLSFFRFPKDKRRCDAWLKYSKRDDLLGLTPDQLYSGYRLCSLHFDKSQYMTVFKKGKLVKSACPTVEQGKESSAEDAATYDDVSIDNESSDSSSNVVTLLLECDSVQSEIIPVPQKTYLTANSNIVTLSLECESEPCVN